jgi:hypothetical protein
MGNKKIKELHNKYIGEALFMVGNGKSLQITPLEKMKYTMAMNNIALIYDERNWRPTFYWNVTMQINQDPWWYEQACKSIELGIPCFLREETKLPTPSNVIKVRYMYIFQDDIPFPMWSKDASKFIFHYRMSIYGATQMACYMGFNPIYMVGCDTNFSINPDECHFINNYEGNFKWTDERIKHENYWQSIAHRWIKRYTNHLGIKVYNATVGGNLEVYPRVNVEDVI